MFPPWNLRLNPCPPSAAMDSSCRQAYLSELWCQSTLFGRKVRGRFIDSQSRMALGPLGYRPPPRGVSERVFRGRKAPEDSFGDSSGIPGPKGPGDSSKGWAVSQRWDKFAGTFRTYGGWWGLFIAFHVSDFEVSGARSFLKDVVGGCQTALARKPVKLSSKRTKTVQTLHKPAEISLPTNREASPLVVVAVQVSSPGRFDV